MVNRAPFGQAAVWHFTLTKLERSHYQLGADLKAALEPCSAAQVPQVMECLAALKTVCMGKKENGEDVAFSLQIYSELLEDYPLWAIQAATKDWLKSQKWFPSPAELIGLIEHRLALPKAVLAGFVRAKTQEEKPKQEEKQRPQVPQPTWAGKFFCDLTEQEKAEMRQDLMKRPKENRDSYIKYANHSLGYPARGAKFWKSDEDMPIAGHTANA